MANLEKESATDTGDITAAPLEPSQLRESSWQEWFGSRCRRSALWWFQL